MATPYRSIEPSAPAELVCGKTTGESSTAVPLGIILFLALIACIANGFVIASVALVGANAGWMFHRFRRRPEGFLFRVSNGGLVVTQRASGRVIARMRLAEIKNVSLDTKSIRKVGPGQHATSAMQFIDSSVGPEIDVARVVIEGPSSIPLTDAFVAHMDAIEWTGKIRAFLRAHGWTPPVEEPGLDCLDDGELT